MVTGDVRYIHPYSLQLQKLVPTHFFTFVASYIGRKVNSTCHKKQGSFTTTALRQKPSTIKIQIYHKQRPELFISCTLARRLPKIHFFNLPKWPSQTSLHAIWPRCCYYSNNRAMPRQSKFNEGCSDLPRREYQFLWKIARLTEHRSEIVQYLFIIRICSSFLLGIQVQYN